MKEIEVKARLRDEEVYKGYDILWIEKQMV